MEKTLYRLLKLQIAASDFRDLSFFLDYFFKVFRITYFRARLDRKVSIHFQGQNIYKYFGCPTMANFRLVSSSAYTNADTFHCGDGKFLVFESISSLPFRRIQFYDFFRNASIGLSPFCFGLTLIFNLCQNFIQPDKLVTSLFIVQKVFFPVQLRCPL